MIRGYSDHAANERTFLAWVRTGIAVIAFGFVIEKFNLFVLTMANASSLDAGRRLQLERLSGPLGRYEGLALILIGIALVVVAAARFVRTGQLLDDQETHSVGGVRGVSRYFARFRLGLAWLVPRSMTSTAPAIRIFPDFTGSKKLLSARNGISAWSTSTTPSSGSRWGSIIDRRSFCASNQAVLYVMPSWASSWTADMPFECVAMRCAAQNHTVSGNLDRCIAVPAVSDVWRPQSRHS